MVKESIKAEKEGYDAIVIYCFSDVGIDAIRENVRIPVIGPGETSLAAASMLCNRFTVLTSESINIPRTYFEWYASIPVVGNFPFAIILLVGMGIYFTVRTRGVQFRFFKAGIKTPTQKKKGDVGVSPLASFLLSTAMRVGPGNLTGVTGAVAVGGPGAISWMWISEIFGMASSFIESTLSQILRRRMEMSM